MKGVAQVDTSLLALSVIAVLLPVAFDMALPATGGTNSAKMKDDDTLSISYGVRGFFSLCIVLTS
jgi:hypothetical protein